MRFLNRIRKPVNRSLGFGKLYGHFLCLIKVNICFIEVRICRIKAEIRHQLAAFKRYFRYLNTHYAAKIKGKPVINGYGSCKITANAKRNIGKLQGRISLVVYRVYICLDFLCFAYKLHHLTNKNVTFSVHQLIAELG